MIQKKETQRGRGDRGRKTALALVLLTILLIVFTRPAAANAPKEVALSYDAAARTLTVQITHPSPAPSMHYVKYVEIKIDGKPLLSEKYTSQPAPATFSYTYPVEPGAGNVLEVTASCNLFGSRTEKLDLPKTGAEGGK
jgi:hypothetical protein